MYSFGRTHTVNACYLALPFKEIKRGLRICPIFYKPYFYFGSVVQAVPSVTQELPPYHLFIGNHQFKDNIITAKPLCDIVKEFSFWLFAANALADESNCRVCLEERVFKEVGREPMRHKKPFVIFAFDFLTQEIISFADISELIASGKDLVPKFLRQQLALGSLAGTCL